MDCTLKLGHNERIVPNGLGTARFRFGRKSREICMWSTKEIRKRFKEMEGLR
jgi:hypothetical protein